jgi:Calx-beta domain
MTRLHRRLGAVAAAVAAPAALLGVVHSTANAGTGSGSGSEVVITADGTICWETPPPGGDCPCEATVRLSAPAPVPVTVTLTTANGTAVAPYDYTAIPPRRVTIPAGALSVKVPLDIRPDEIHEPDEWFFVKISDPSIGRIENGSARVTIKDGAPPR